MQSLAWSLHVFLALAASAHILLHKRQPRSALPWLVWVWLFPVAGSVVYLYLGLNQVGRPPHRLVPERRKGRPPGFDTLAAAVAGTPLRTGNRARMFIDGTEGYPAMLASIRAARLSVDLQTYIFDFDRVGTAFLAELEAAAGRGVRVRVLLDGLGAGIRGHLKRRLKLAGGEVRHYWRLGRFFRQPLLNLRNHRKLLVCDGSVAFTGGLNISHRYAKGPIARLRDLGFLVGGRPPVRDVHFAIWGTLVGDLESCFRDDWKHSGGTEAPVHARGAAGGVGPGAAGPGAVGRVAARVVRSGPDEDVGRIYEVLLGALSLAGRSVDLCTPYFIPDQPLLAMLRILGYRGVRVRLFVPCVSDHPFMHWAGQEYYQELLDAGVEIWEMGRPFVHAKLAVVDGRWSFLGSSNLDIRSFRLNFELNVEIRSRALAAGITALLESYRQGARKVENSRAGRRPAWVRLRGALVNLAAPYL